MHARPDAALFCHCAHRDDVDVKVVVTRRVLCDTLVYGTLEGLEIGLGKSEDVLWFVELDGGREEHGEIALEFGDDLAGSRILWIWVVEEGRGEIACKEAVDKRL